MRSRVAFALAMFVLSVAASARAEDDDKNGVHRPERLTAGVADQFLGQLAPDGKTLYFVSSRNTTNELYQEDVNEGRTRLAFDEDAEVTWPRLRRDGRAVLYISFRNRAEGQLCVRDLPGGASRRCLDTTSAALQAEWIDSERIVLVARESVQSGLRVLEVKVGSKLTARGLLEANVTSPAVSPDGHWLLYVPLERYGARIGAAFASHVAKHLEMVSLDHPAEAPTLVTIDLPGSTGQPVFARDGRSIYIAQFFSDSNHDGIVDGNDHGVLFRIPFSDSGGHVVMGEPIQLTDSSRNCQYPAPAADRLIATCMGNQNLDVYSLPLGGEVPAEWNEARIAEEGALANQPAMQLLLFRHRLMHETTVAARRLTILQLVRLHVDLEEFHAAEFYVQRLSTLGDPATAEMAEPLLTLIAHRRAVRARERGRDVDDFRSKTHERIESLAPKPTMGAPTVALGHIVRSELADASGDKSMARAELEAAVIDDATPPGVVELYYERADALYRELDDRDALASVCRKLASRTSSGADVALRFARAAVRGMIRGMRWADADALLARERAALGEGESGSELAFAMDLGRAVIAIRDKDPPASVRDALLTLYARQPRSGRRRAIVLDAVQRASQLGADRVIEQLSERYVDDAEPGTQERRRAERLYRRALVGRAFRREASGHPKEARADFEAVVKRTGSYEALVGSIDLRLRGGESRASIDADYGARGETPTLKSFVTAYLLATSLLALDAPHRTEATNRAIEIVRKSWKDFKDNGVAQSLFGAMMHERYLETHDAAFAERANVHYLVALDLVRSDPRFRALVLGQLGMLHTEVGNFRIALGFLDSRDGLPYVDDAASLGIRLTKARALAHVSREKDAAEAADAAIAMVDRDALLAPYRTLAIDRGALYNLAAQRFDRARALYDAELPLIDAGPDTRVARRNRFVVRLARSAAALGAHAPQRALEDLERVDRDLCDARVTSVLVWPHAEHEDVLRSYRLLSAGLRAHAHGDLGDLEAEASALDERRELLSQMFARSNRNEYLRALSLVESQLADNASTRHANATAGRWVTASLQHADTLHARTNEPLDTRQLDVVWLASKLGALDHVPVPLDLVKRMAAAEDELARHAGSPSRTFARWFDVYAPLVP